MCLFIIAILFTIFLLLFLKYFIEIQLQGIWHFLLWISDFFRGILKTASISWIGNMKVASNSFMFRTIILHIKIRILYLVLSESYIVILWGRLRSYNKLQFLGIILRGHLWCCIVFICHLFGDMWKFIVEGIHIRSFCLILKLLFI